MKSIHGERGIQTFHPEDIPELIQSGEINAETITFNEPAMAIWEGDAERLAAILSVGGWDLRYSSAGAMQGIPSYPLLTLAAKMGQCACIDVLLEARANIDEWVTSPNGEREHVGTPVMVAIENLKGDAVELLLGRNADPNGTDVALNRPTHLAAMFDDVRTLALLAAASADLGAKNMNGKTALHFAIKKEKPRATEWLLKGAQSSQTFNLSETLREPDVNGETPLHYALAIGSKAAAHLLIEREYYLIACS